MDPNKLQEAQVLLNQLYQMVQRAWPGFIARSGQIKTMQAVLGVMLQARGSNDPADGSNIAAIEAPTGTGKTLGYLLPAFAAACVLDKPVVVSTATVALQEQLHYQDLPRLAKIVGPDMSFDIIKGRQRYVCALKIDRSSDQFGDGLDDGDSDTPPAGGACVDQLRDAYLAGRWNGDRDAWNEAIDDGTWRGIEANRSSCLRSRCSHYQQCAFYNARRRAVEAKIVIVNHALVLATLTQESSLLKPSQSLFVFDEGHHLPEVAVEAFSTHVQLDRFVRACGRAGGLLTKAAELLSAEMRQQVPPHRLALQDAARELERIRDELGEIPIETKNGVTRFANGELPGEWQPVVDVLYPAVNTGAQFGVQVLQELADRGAEDQRIKVQADRASMELGPVIRQLADGAELLKLWRAKGAVPMAKWFQRNEKTGGITLCASPLTGAKGLAEHVWSTVGAAVVTSATLTACGEFTMFSRLSGLNRFPKHAEVVVESPFDFRQQGRLFIPKMRSTPKDGLAFTQEFQALVPQILRAFDAGQLVLFASKRMMESVCAAMPQDLREHILMQGQRPRKVLLAEHRERVAAGRPSILFGLQSFGEGVDLPGRLCEHVLIEKIPFAPPDSPVDQALADWLVSEHRNPFAELTVPRAGIKLAQWVGRGVRTTSDCAVITICDTRLHSQEYGKRLLRGLPEMPFAQSVEHAFG